MTLFVCEYQKIKQNPVPSEMACYWLRAGNAEPAEGKHIQLKPFITLTKLGGGDLERDMKKQRVPRQGGLRKNNEFHL